MTDSFSPYPDSAQSTKETEGPDERALCGLVKNGKAWRELNLAPLGLMGQPYYTYPSHPF